MANRYDKKNGKFTFKNSNPNFTKELLETEYFENELSSVKIAKKYGCSKKYVLDKLKEFGIDTRTAGQTRKLHYKNGGVHPMQGKRKIVHHHDGYDYLYIGNGKYQSVHRLVWISANNQEIPRGYQVHHIDGNKRNNNPDNLILLSEREHKKLHRAQERLEKIKEKSGVAITDA